MRACGAADPDHADDVDVVDAVPLAVRRVGRVEVEHGNACALLDQPAGDRGTDAGCPSRDDRDEASNSVLTSILSLGVKPPWGGSGLDKLLALTAEPVEYFGYVGVDYGPIWRPSLQTLRFKCGGG